MGAIKNYTEAEAIYAGLPVQGWRRYINKYTVKGKNGFAAFTIIGTIIACIKVQEISGREAHQAAKQKKIDEYNSFVAEKDKWLNLGKKFDVNDWRKF